MRMHLVLIGLLGFLCLPAGLSAAPAASEKQPRAEVAKPRWDFPAVVEGSSVQHDFVIRNTGRAVLEIQKVKTG